MEKTTLPRPRYLLDINEREELALTGDYFLDDVRYEPLGPSRGLEWLGVYGRELRQCHYVASVKKEFPTGHVPWLTYRPEFHPEEWKNGKWWGNR